MLGKEIKKLLSEKGITQQELAQKIGVSVGEINHWITERRELKASDVADICKALDITPNNLFGQETKSIPVVGYVQAGLWQEAKQWEVSDFEVINIPVDERFLGKNIFALEVRGESMNLLYPKGSFVVCISIEDYYKTEGILENNKRVVVQRINEKDGTTEATVKEYVKNENGTYLVPRSTDLSFTPIRTDDGSAGEAKITAVVIGSFRKE